MMCDVKYHVHSCSTFVFGTCSMCTSSFPVATQLLTWDLRSLELQGFTEVFLQPNGAIKLIGWTICRYILAIFTYNGWFAWFSVMNRCFNHYLEVGRSRPSMAIYSQIHRHKKGIISSCYFCGSPKNMKVFYWCGDADHASSVGSSLSPWFTRSLKSSGCTDALIALLSWHLHSKATWPQSSISQLDDRLWWLWLWWLLHCFASVYASASVQVQHELLTKVSLTGTSYSLIKLSFMGAICMKRALHRVGRDKPEHLRQNLSDQHQSCSTCLHSLGSKTSGKCLEHFLAITRDIVWQWRSWWSWWSPRSPSWVITSNQICTGLSFWSLAMLEFEVRTTISIFPESPGKCTWCMLLRRQQKYKVLLLLILWKPWNLQNKDHSKARIPMNFTFRISRMFHILQPQCLWSCSNPT